MKKVLIVLFIFSMLSCKGKKVEENVYREKESAYEATTVAEENVRGAGYVKTPAPSSSANTPSENEGIEITERMIAKEGTIEITTNKVEGTYKELITHLGNNPDIIILNTNLYKGTYTSAIIQLEIKPQGFDSLVNEMEKSYNVTSFSISSTDYTSTYVDLKARLKNATAIRDEYRALIKKAYSVSDIISIEREIDRVQERIERLSAQLKQIEHQVSYSKLNISIAPRTKSKREGVFTIWYKGITLGTDIVVWIVFIILALLPIGIIGFLVYIIIRAIVIRKKRA